MLPILYSAYDAGAPVLNNGAGSMIAVLDACLVTGFNPRGVTSMTVSGNVCTVVTETPHGYAVDQRVTHAGSVASALQGAFVVASVPSSRSYAFDVVTANVTDTSVGMTAIRTPLGWSKEFTGTQKAVYKMGSLQSYGQRLRVVDDATTPTCARVTGVEFPTAIDVFADKFPTEAQLVGGGFWPKGANTVAPKFWCIVGDDRCFYFIVEWTAYTGSYATDYVTQAFFFGDPISLKQGEAFGAVLFSADSSIGFPSNLGKSTSIFAAPSSPGDCIARQHTGLNKSVRIHVVHPVSGDHPGGVYLPGYPSPIDNGVVFTEPSFITEQLSGNPIRAILPGFVTLLGRGYEFPNVLGPNIVNTTDGRNQKLVIFHRASTNGNVNYAVVLKLSVDWRA